MYGNFTLFCNQVHLLFSTISLLSSLGKILTVDFANWTHNMQRTCIKGQRVPAINTWKENILGAPTPMAKIGGSDEPHIVGLIRTQLPCLKNVALAVKSSAEGSRHNVYLAQAYMCRMLAYGQLDSVELLSEYETVSHVARNWQIDCNAMRRQVYNQNRIHDVPEYTPNELIFWKCPIVSN
jgi:hypothetical protein